MLDLTVVLRYPAPLDSGFRRNDVWVCRDEGVVVIGSSSVGGGQPATPELGRDPPLSFGPFPPRSGEETLAGARPHPGIPRSRRFACSRPFRFTKGAKAC